PPGKKPGKVDPQNVRYSGPLADCSELSDGREDEGPFLAAAECRLDVLRYALAFSQCMLGGRRIGASGLGIRDERTVAQGPDTGPVRNFEEFVYQQSSPILVARQSCQQRVGRSPCGPDQGLGGDRRAVAQLCR